MEAANEVKAQFAAAIPLNRLGRPDEIAAAALFLASDDSSFVAGAELSSMAAWPRSSYRTGPFRQPAAQRLWMRLMHQPPYEISDQRFRSAVHVEVLLPVRANSVGLNGPHANVEALVVLPAR